MERSGVRQISFQQQREPGPMTMGWRGGELGLAVQDSALFLTVNQQISNHSQQALTNNDRHSDMTSAPTRLTTLGGRLLHSSCMHIHVRTMSHSKQGAGRGIDPGAGLGAARCALAGEISSNWENMNQLVTKWKSTIMGEHHHTSSTAIESSKQ